MKRAYLIIPLILFVGDRTIKYFAPQINFGGDFIKFELYKNFSGAFSLPIAGPLYNILGIVLILIFLIFFISSLKRKQLFFAVLYSLIILGGASNMFDRLSFGYVIDYIQVAERSFFNIADAMLLGGVIILFAVQFRRKKEKV